MRPGPRRCSTCASRPIAMKDVPYCFVCWPTGPVTPPPCLRCGSADYFMSGLCARCHPHSPQGVDSCTDCYAWGATRTHKWRCKGCEHWHGHHPVGACPVCRRTVTLNAEEGVCRLCLRQRAYMRQLLGLEVDLVEATCDGHQLFLADLIHRNGTGRRFKRKPAGPPPPPIRPATHRQLVLFDLRRDLHAGLRKGFPPPPDPGLDAALSQITRTRAARYGWNKSLTERTQRGIRILLGTSDTPGAPIQASDVTVLAAIGIGAPTVIGVLSEAGMLDDDRTPTIEAWFDRRTADIPVRMREELRIWFDVMRHGSTTYPRRKPRAASTIYAQLDFALPALRVWAHQHESLREISREDFLAILPTSGTPRATLIGGVRSIFRVLKPRKVVFTDPTYRVGGAVHDKPLPRPVDVATLRSLIDSDDPVRAALAAILAFHGLRSGQLLRLHLTDLHDGRLHVDGRFVLLAPLVQRKLAAWLDYRNRRWPNTANPHLFIHYKTATHTGAARPWWICKKLGIPAQALRQDRILDEAIATGGDARRLTDLFGLSITQAARYTTAADHPGMANFEHSHG